MLFSKCLRLRLGLSLSLNSPMAIQWQNSCGITIRQIGIKLVKWQNGNSETKQLLNYHSAIWPTFPKLPNGNSATVLSSNCHSTVQPQTQTQTEPEAYRMHVKVSPGRWGPTWKTRSHYGITVVCSLPHFEHLFQPDSNLQVNNYSLVPTLPTRGSP